MLPVRYKLMLLLTRTPWKCMVFSPFLITSTPCVIVTSNPMQSVPVALFYSSTGGMSSLKHETNMKCLETCMCRFCWRGMKVVGPKSCQSCAKISLLWSCARIPQSTAVYPFIKYNVLQQVQRLFQCKLCTVLTSSFSSSFQDPHFFSRSSSSWLSLLLSLFLTFTLLLSFFQ